MQAGDQRVLCRAVHRNPHAQRVARGHFDRLAVGVLHDVQAHGAVALGVDDLDPVAHGEAVFGFYFRPAVLYGFDFAHELAARGQSYDAIFAASDLIAIGAMKALHERGLRVPTDVAIAGFDDIPMAGFVNPSLSTVQQDTKLAGQVLVESLLQLINGQAVESRTLPVKLALRRSSGAS